MIRSENGSKMSHVPKSRKVIEVENPVDTILHQDDYNVDYILAVNELGEKEKSKIIKRGVSFQRYIPVGKKTDNPMGEKQIDYHEVTSATTSKDLQHHNMTLIYETLKKKFHEHKFSISPFVLCIIISTTIVVTCCCTIWLRNQIITCLKICLPSKKKRDYDSLDKESTKKLTKTKFQELKQKYKFSAFPHVDSPQKEYAPVETDEAIEMIEPVPQEAVVETPPSTGCCGVCKSKKKLERNK